MSVWRKQSESQRWSTFLWRNGAGWRQCLTTIIYQCVGCHASCIIIFSWQCNTGIVIETTSLETEPWKQFITYLRDPCPPPTVFPQWECLWDGLWWRHLQAVWSACRPGADDVQPRQHYLRHHLRGVLQERPPAPGRLWWLQLQRLGHAEGRACRWVTPELWLWVLCYWQLIQLL